MTAFDFATYPLVPDARFEYDPAVNVDYAHSRAARLRVTSADIWLGGTLVFVPMLPTPLENLRDYLAANRTTLFTFSGAGFGSATWEGNLVSVPKESNFGGAYRQISVDIWARKLS